MRLPVRIAFASQKGGVGKTTSAMNTAYALALGGYRVLLVDTDPQGSVAHSCRIAPPELGSRQMYLNPEISLSNLVQRTEGFDLILANIEDRSTQIQIAESLTDIKFLRNRLSEIEDQYDFIVIDSPPSTGNVALNSICAADLLIMPLQSEPLAIKSLKRFLRFFRDVQRQHNPTLRIAGVLLTMYNRNMDVHRHVARQLYQSLHDSVLSTIIPYSKDFSEASSLGLPIISYKIDSIGSTAYIRLVKEILERFDLRSSS